MPEYPQTTDKLIDLLRTRGIVEQYNVIRICHHVYGDRIEIIGVYPLNILDKSAPLFETLIVTLPIQSESRFTVDDGVVSPVSDDKTLVYYATAYESRYMVHHYRPGLWERYIDMLREEDERDREFNRKLDRTPIDDRHLFSEFSSPDDQS